MQSPPIVQIVLKSGQQIGFAIENSFLERTVPSKSRTKLLYRMDANFCGMSFKTPVPV